MTTTAHEDQFTPAPVAVADLGPWECFQDSSYYDMWCVRRVHDRTFGLGFHLVNGDEAARLRDHLNTRTASAPADLVEALDICPVCTGAGGDNNVWTCGTCNGSGGVSASTDLVNAVGELLAAQDDIDNWPTVGSPEYAEGAPAWFKALNRRQAAFAALSTQFAKHGGA